MKKYIIALDQGTTSCRAIIFNKKGVIIRIAQQEFTQIYPKPGWVEHDPMEIWGVQSGVVRSAIASSGIDLAEVAAIGITNQRETTVVWDKHTGKPVYNAIVWQSRQSDYVCDELRNKGLADYIRETTGLVVDAYFSGTKIKWILDNVEGARDKALAGDLIFGTIDTWLTWNLTKGDSHVTDVTNAARTMLFDINNMCWDDKILKELGIPKSMLPEVKNSSEVIGVSRNSTLGAHIPIASLIGDQHASMFAQNCFEEGTVKNTYGTGCFVMMNTGKKPIHNKNGILATIAWGINDKVTYALEGSVFIAGAGIQWLRDEMKLIHDAKDSEYFASKVKDTGGVYIVPAFVGLGAPYWNSDARGSIFGMTRGTNRSHIIRATLESIAYQSNDLIEAMRKASNINVTKMNVDGGASNNNFLMQFQSDISNIPVTRNIMTEATAFGAAALAGLAVDFYKDVNEIIELTNVERVFTPDMEDTIRENNLKGWKKAISRSLDWNEEK